MSDNEFRESILKPTYDDLHNASVELYEAREKLNLNPEAVVGVARGGLLPAVHLSHLFEVPLISVSYSSKLGNGDDVNHDNTLPDIEQHKILIVDDIHDSGRTMEEISQHYRAQGKEVFTWVVHFKHRREKTYTVDAYKYLVPETAGWVVYPFEQ